MPTLLDEARARGLSRFVEQLTRWPAPAAAPADAALTSTELVGALPRRGLEPALVDALLGALEEQPLERGLIAWDVLTGSLIPIADEERLARLRVFARAVVGVLPPPASRFVVTNRAKALVERVALPPLGDAQPAQLERALANNSLGALEMMVALATPGDPQLLPALEAVRKYARTLHRAHLLATASFYLDYLWRRARYTPALFDLMEVLLDVGASRQLPGREDIGGGLDADAAELLGYSVGRESVRLKKETLFLADVAKKMPAIDYTRPGVAETLARSHLVVAEAQLAVGQRSVPLEVVTAIVRRHPEWRYAARVRLAMLATSMGTELLPALDDFVAAFGNDAATWSQIARYAPKGAAWLDGMIARLVREPTLLPHDRDAWEGLAFYYPDADRDACLADVRARIEAQSQVAPLAAV